jgi:hypothetical protein
MRVAPCADELVACGKSSAAAGACTKAIIYELFNDKPQIKRDLILAKNDMAEIIQLIKDMAKSQFNTKPL